FRVARERERPMCLTPCAVARALVYRRANQRVAKGERGSELDQLGVLRRRHFVLGDVELSTRAKDQRDVARRLSRREEQQALRRGGQSADVVQERVLESSVDGDGVANLCDAGELIRRQLAPEHEKRERVAAGVSKEPRADVVGERRIHSDLQQARGGGVRERVEVEFRKAIERRLALAWVAHSHQEANAICEQPSR